MTQQALQTYGHLTGAAASNSSSTTSLTAGGGGIVGGSTVSGAVGGSGIGTGGTETVKPRKHAIPIIHPITHENILDPKPQKKSTAVEAKPSPTDIAPSTEESTAGGNEPLDKSITVSMAKTPTVTVVAMTKDPQSEGASTAAVSVAVQSSTSKEKIDQQMQTDAVRDRDRDRSTCRRVSAYDATDASPTTSHTSGDEDTDNYVYGDFKTARGSDSNADSNETAVYLNEEERQLDEELTGMHTATGDDGEDSNYDEGKC